FQLPVARGSAAEMGEALAGGSGYLNARPSVASEGSKVCASCHAEIYEEFSRTRMGRSMSLSSGSASRLAGVPSLVFDAVSQQYYQVSQRGPDLYQSVYGVGADGKHSFRHTEQLAYAIGSGVNAIGYVIRRGDFLFQAPLAFYTKTRTWDLAPAYRGHDVGFSRAITPRCIACHSGLPQPVPNRSGLYKNPPFQELAIGCENCHGPGQLHVEARLKGKPVSGSVDRTIVNPARLPIWLASNVCMSCHEDGDAQVLKPGKSFLDIRPGVPLDDVVALFKLRPTRGSVDLLDRFGEMISSRCYDSSDGQLGCLTCHDPHYEPSPEEAVGYYRTKCLSCHTDRSCGLSLEARLSQSPPNDCAGCHMLKRDVRLPHSSITNHRIVATRSEPYPEFMFRPATSDLPGLIHLDAIPGAENANPSPLTLLEVYRQVLLSTRDPKYVGRYLAVLDQLAVTQPANPVVLSALAQRAALDGTPAGTDNAIQFLKQALVSGANDEGDTLLLAELLIRKGRPSEAITVLHGGILVDPYYAPFYGLLAVCYMNTGKPERARDVIKQGLRQVPENQALRELLDKATKTTAP
ncbi:MAG: hypothetical protein ACRD2O_15745, partial [Terriglobia bacterium]